MTDEIPLETPAPKKESKVKSLLNKITKKFASGKKVLLEAANEREALWNTVGYHRITGGFFYSYILMIGGAVIGLITISWIMPIFLPYPEINGYKNLVNGTILGFWFGLFDAGLGGGGGMSDGVARFIGQYADSNPYRSMRYINFYIWWQMLTGLIQVTLFVGLACFFFIHTNFAYLSSFIVVASLVQYPGMLMIMKSSLWAFQRGDKTAWLGWLNDTVFSTTTTVIFLIVGKWWGDTNPAIGELAGIIYFYILSDMIGQYFPLVLGGWMFSKVLKRHGIRLREMFDPHIDKKVAKECLWYTGKQYIAGQIGGFAGFLVNLYIVSIFPSFTNWSGLLNIANIFGNLAGEQGPMMGQAVPAFSESYNNGKKELCRYFIHNSLKYYGFITGFMATSLVVLASQIIKYITIAFPGLQYYLLASVLVPSVILTSAIGPLTGLPDKIWNACNRPLTPIVLGYILTPLGYGVQFLFVYLCIWTNTLPIWVYLIYPGFVMNIIRTIIAYAWIQKTLLKIDYKRIAWQVILAPVLAAASYGFVLYILTLTFWPWMNSMFTLAIGPTYGLQYGVLAGSLIMLFAVLFVFPGALYAPFLALFGGWDEFTLEEFRKAALISGPSRGITLWIYKSFKIFSRISPWYNKHPIADYEIVQNEVEDLVAEGKAHALLRK